MNDAAAVTFHLDEPIDLKGVVLPPGEYPGEVTFMRIAMRGRQCRQLGRANLFLTAEEMASFGAPLSGSATMIGVDIVKWVKAGDIRCVEIPDAGENLVS